MFNFVLCPCVKNLPLLIKAILTRSRIYQLFLLSANHHSQLHIRASTATQNRNLIKYFVYDGSGVGKERELKKCGIFLSNFDREENDLMAGLHFTLYQFQRDTSSHPRDTSKTAMRSYSLILKTPLLLEV